MTKPKKAIPHFASELEERQFWEAHDSADYIDWSKAKRMIAQERLRSITSQAIIGDVVSPVIDLPDENCRGSSDQG